MRNLRTANSDALAVTAAEKIELLQAAIERVIRGKPDAVRLAIVTLLAGGHLVIEDVPGDGQTTLAHALSRALDSSIVLCCACVLAIRERWMKNKFCATASMLRRSTTWKR